MSMFQKAVRKKAKLRLLLTGPSGSGKTYSALLLAQGLGAKKIAVIDTEKGSASLYAHLCDFDVLELDPPYNPERFIEAITDAGAGYDALIIDSTTHEWSGVGGCLELVDKIAASKYRGNSWSAWNDVTPRHRAFIDAMLRAPLHIIATGRSKTETAQVEENGRKKVVKLGMKAEQRDGIEYEFTTVLELAHETHLAVPGKDRTGVFGSDPELITKDTGARLLYWLESGADLKPEKAAAPAAPATPAAIAARVTAQVQANNAKQPAEWLATLSDEKRGAIWNLLAPEVQDELAINWPEAA